jgi:hypothetical protein
MVKCGVYEDDGSALVELNVSVANKSQAKTVVKNWKNNVTEIYGMLLNRLLDDKNADEMKTELEANLGITDIPKK